MNIDGSEDGFLWRRYYDVDDPTKLTRLIKLRLLITEEPTAEDASFFVCLDDELNGLEKFMLFTMDKEVMIGLKIPEVEKYKSALYRVYDVADGKLRSLWVDKREDEIVDFKRIIVDLAPWREKLKAWKEVAYDAYES